ncbi:MULTISPECIES: hypothetical protein [unclassified Methylobacterium]|uniref:hypothetical protein n=1 Tax=unclassified Methylobacterium TaxID=2615210 RepID=UPI0012372C32|nr:MULTISPECIES: hypothetical protein [Methylobacterium]WFT82074.1 hypothetical protein QA634_09560 [Methylobacterium nodulans]
MSEKKEPTHHDLDRQGSEMACELKDRDLNDCELDNVVGGLSSSVSEVMKNFGSALQTAGRGG